MIKLTSLELAILSALDESEYGDWLDSDIWTFSVWDNIERKLCPNRVSLSGGISSLVQKGLVRVGGSGKDAYVGMTPSGSLAYIEALRPLGEHPKKQPLMTT